MFDPNPELDQLLRKLLHPKLKAIDPSLDRIVKLLEVLGSPHKQLPPVIHIAGTNGKGSTLAFLQSILNAGGYSTHSYTSPHLVRFNERIRLCGEEIKTDELFPILERILSYQDEYPTTFFEATTIAAFIAFSEVDADLVLLETGMGGRLDATNVIDEPAVTIITPIGIDHGQFLGSTLGQIAFEKAGILKGNVPAIIAPQPSEALEAIMEQGDKAGVEWHRCDKEWSFTRHDDGSWSFKSARGDYLLPKPALLGEHQYMNAAAAVAAAEQLQGITLSEPLISQGIQQAKWAARIQPLESGYWRGLLPDGFRLFLDGGHNVMAASQQTHWLEGNYPDTPIYIVFGMLADKDAAGFISQFKRVSAEIYTVDIDVESPVYSGEELKEISAPFANCVQYASTVEKAFEGIAKRPEGVVLITGSLYLAAAILGKN